MAPPLHLNGPSPSTVYYDEWTQAALVFEKYRRAIADSIAVFASAAASLLKLLERSRASLDVVRPSPLPAQRWAVTAALCPSQHHPRSVPWRGHVGWVRSAGRRPLRGLRR